VPSQPTNPVEVFYSYAHEDEKLRDELTKHLANLKRQGIITQWYDRDISAGKEWDDEIRTHLNSASVVLLLISPDFMNSDYSNDVEVKRAMERHEAKEARVIPIILRPVDWEGAPFSKLEALPTDAKPVTSWDDQDEAFLGVTRGVRKAVAELAGPSLGIPSLPEIPRPPKVGFVSRRDQTGRNIVERLRDELALGKNQLVALWGAGGVGKTALAAEAVRLISETFGWRIVWITADGRQNFAFSTLLDEIAEQLGRSELRHLASGLKEEALRPLLNLVPTLITLDNLETISPEEEMLCKEFLAKRVLCPALITTRERIDDAYLIPLTAMSPDEATELLQKLKGQSPDPDLYEEIDSELLLETAEFNPLIIQWIVGQIDLAQEPMEVLTELGQGEGDAAQRVFDRSFNLPQMAEGGRALLLALSLFMPTATRSALAEVAGMNKNKDKKRFKKALQTLASLWLLKQSVGGQRLAVEGLTRELAKAHLHTDIRANGFRRRFIARFLALARTNSRNVPAAFSALAAEKDNLLTAMDLAFARAEWSIVAGLYSLIGNFLRVQGYWDDAVRYGKLTVEAGRIAQDKLVVAGASNDLSIMLIDRGEFHEAQKAVEQALIIFRELEHQPDIAGALHNMGVIAQELGDKTKARELFDESLSIKDKDDLNIATTLHHLGTLSISEGKFEEAETHLTESLRILKKMKNNPYIAESLESMGKLRTAEGEYSAAKDLFKEALETAESMADQLRIGSIKYSLGLLAETQEKTDEALGLYSEALIICERLGAPKVPDIKNSLARLQRLT